MILSLCGAKKYMHRKINVQFVYYTLLRLRNLQDMGLMDSLFHISLPVSCLQVYQKGTGLWNCSTWDILVHAKSISSYLVSHVLNNAFGIVPMSHNSLPTKNVFWKRHDLWNGVYNFVLSIAFASHMEISWNKEGSM